MNPLLLATIVFVGAATGNFVVEMVAETSAHVLNGVYENGFYQTPPPMAPGSTQLAALPAGPLPEDAYLEKLCRIPPAR
ncbi:MAG: hypothetical protein HOL85_17740 [Rhodospirillaceae bacterium]|jgi:hypothetical protein|nr:hypothetical protein [Rhodospirillaceae bacterium]MBT6137913.1 hypothetical protein [Rhodospirillaceae bacterium]